MGSIVRRAAALAGVTVLSASGLMASGLVGAVVDAAPAAAAAPVGAGFAWGDNFYRQLGDGNPTGTNVVNPTPASGLSGVTDIVATAEARSRCAAGPADWSAWGYGPNAEICNGASDTHYQPTTTSVPAGTATIAGGGFHELLVDGGATAGVW